MTSRSQITWSLKVLPYSLQPNMYDMCLTYLIDSWFDTRVVKNPLDLLAVEVGHANRLYQACVHQLLHFLKVEHSLEKKNQNKTGGCGVTHWRTVNTVNPNTDLPGVQIIHIGKTQFAVFHWKKVGPLLIWRKKRSFWKPWRKHQHWAYSVQYGTLLACDNQYKFSSDQLHN